MMVAITKTKQIINFKVVIGTAVENVIQRMKLDTTRQWSKRIILNIMDSNWVRCGTVNGMMLKKHLENKNKLEHDARQQNINVRDFLFGERDEGF